MHGSTQKMVDRQVQAEARAAQAQILSSEAFAAMVKETRNLARKAREDRKLSEDEVEEWLEIVPKGEAETVACSF